MRLSHRLECRQRHGGGKSVRETRRGPSHGKVSSTPTGACSHVHRHRLPPAVEPCQNGDSVQKVVGRRVLSQRRYHDSPYRAQTRVHGFSRSLTNYPLRRLYDSKVQLEITNRSMYFNFQLHILMRATISGWSGSYALCWPIPICRSTHFAMNLMYVAVCRNIILSFCTG